MATKKKDTWTASDEKAYQERKTRQYAAQSDLRNAEKRADSLSSPSNRIMGTMNYLAGKEAGDAAEASRKKRLEIADADSDRARARYEAASRPPMSKKWVEK